MSLRQAIQTGDLAELPSRRDEDWRWSDLRGLLRTLPPASGIWSGALEVGPFDHLAERAETVVNGRGVVSLDIPSGASTTIALRFVSREAGAHAGRATIRIGEGARVVLLESYEGDTSRYVSEIDLEIQLAEGATLERIVLAADDPDAVSVSSAEVRLSPRASFVQSVLTTGARRQRLETRVVHPGGGAETRLDGVYLLGERRHADITTVVSHDGEGGATDQLTKGVVRDQARGVFQGRIVVARGADRTDAKMGHHGLVLSDRAEIDAKPELEIYADDVACSHGNSIGALDEAALFYAGSRGIPEPQARAMLIEAFVAEVVDRIEHKGAREVAREWVAARLGGD
jgi:Fe-S cluster assembly protein SufD